MRKFRQLREPSRFVLIPFDPREVTTVAACARMIGYDVSTVRSLVARHELGRKIGPAGVDVFGKPCRPGAYMVSKVAWALFVSSDWTGLYQYHLGNRQHPTVRAEFARLGIFVPECA